MGGLAAMQKKCAYGKLWGRVSGPSELPPYDRLEVSVLSALEEELYESSAVQRLGQVALHKVIEGLQDTLLTLIWVREDGRYAWEHPVVKSLSRNRKKDFCGGTAGTLDDSGGAVKSPKVERLEQMGGSST